MNKQLSINPDAANEKWQKNHAVSLKELACVLGVGYEAVRDLGRMPSFPWLTPKRRFIIPSEFKEWRKEILRSQRMASHRQLEVVDRSDESTRMNDSQAALPPKAERLLEQAGLRMSRGGNGNTNAKG